MIELKLIDTGIPIEIQKHQLVENLPGLQLKVNQPSNSFYRFDGAVNSIPLHLIKILNEFGYKVENADEVIKFWKGYTAHCRHFIIPSKNTLVKVSIPFYRSINQECDLFNLGHEDMHAVQHLELNEAYLELNKRLIKINYGINIEEITDIEKQANVAGLLRIIEEGKNLKKILNFPAINSAYLLMQEFRI